MSSVHFGHISVVCSNLSLSWVLLNNTSKAYFKVTARRPVANQSLGDNNQGFSWVRSNLTGRVRSGAKKMRCFDLTQIDPRSFEPLLTRPDPTREN